MKYLFNNLDKILPEKPVMLFLDYDGTLTPIVKTPEKARLNLSARRLLKKLSKKLVLCIISGRSLRDIKGLVEIPGIIYAGNHGLEIDYYGRTFVHPAAQRSKNKLQKMLRMLKYNLSDIPGLLIENKGVTLSIHYRNVKKGYLRKIKMALGRLSGVRITYGKKVFEVRPPVKWDKGFCVKKIVNSRGRGLLPIYIGDDSTDEDAFEMLKSKGLTIFVGRPGKSSAEYYARDTKEVAGFLEQLLCRN